MFFVTDPFSLVLRLVSSHPIDVSQPVEGNSLVLLDQDIDYILLKMRRIYI